MTLRIPPPIHFLCFAGMAWAAAHYLPALSYSWNIGNLLGYAAIGAGVMSAAVSISGFLSTGTTIDPRKPDRASVLVTGGFYRFSRNPMYLGLVLVLIGISLLLQNVVALLTPAGLVISLTRLQIIPEEQALESRFGDDFRAYCKRTRRWI